jgi:hypothetical protein
MIQKKSLRNISRRSTLILILKELADVEMQKTKWVSLDRNDGFWSDLWMRIDFISNDLALEDFPEEQLGTTLYNQREIEAIKPVVQLLDRVWNEIGPKQADGAYLDSPLWPQLVEASQKAYAYLRASDQAHGLVYPWVTLLNEEIET